MGVVSRPYYRVILPEASLGSLELLLLLLFLLHTACEGMWSLCLFILHTVKAQETWEKPARFVHSRFSAILRDAFASKFGTSPYRLRCPFRRAR